ncbi:terminase [Microbacterium sp. LWH13-1.2]|uniref:terminase n=1 Tax=Microbacterium sp. LWH13-1.2 TaxID=3135260 RepID=UPI003138CF19
MARMPSGLGKPGQKLWKSIDQQFDLAEHERTQLEQACRVRDTIELLREQVIKDGVMIRSSQGDRLHPAIVEVRQQQLALARLLATLKVPGLEEDDLPSSRPARGVYALRSAS